MADAPTVLIPDVVLNTDQKYFLRPLKGSDSPLNYLDRFPEDVYNKSIDSHLVKFMYALLGPSGVGSTRKEYLEARLILEESGLETFNLDSFYGDPFRFGRILEETYGQDSRSTLSRQDWEVIRAKDARYRNRAIDFINGARAGGTPLGIRLVARSGLGHEVEIIENYRYIYDKLTDDPLGLDKYGQTNSTEEFVVVPRRELPQSNLQVLTITGNPTGGFFTLFYPVGDESRNTTQSIGYNAPASSVQSFLEQISSIGPGNIMVTGGPLPNTPIKILFTGKLANRDIPHLASSSQLLGGTSPLISVTDERSGINQTEEIVGIGPRDGYYLKTALDKIRPVSSIVTFGRGSGLKTNQAWSKALATSQYHEVLRYVTGQTGVVWPRIDANNYNWIEKSIEKQAPRVFNDFQHQYAGFHNISEVLAYTEEAVALPSYLTDQWALDKFTYKNNQVGRFGALQQFLFPFLRLNTNDLLVYTPDRVPADYAEPLTISASTADSQGLVNGIYPTSYNTLPGVPEIKYKDDQFWASRERSGGTDYLEIDLGEIQIVNYLYFEVSRKPYDIDIDYDLLDDAPMRRWQPVTYLNNFASSQHISYNASAQNPWQLVVLHIGDALQDPLYTRFLRIKFTKRNDKSSPFIDDTGNPLPFSIEARNLRVARNIS
jgi:hypothetical protein